MAKLWISFLTLFLLHTIQSVPSNAPSNAPTHAPSIAPIFRFVPTNAPTLTQKYVYVRSTGCDWGDCGSPATKQPTAITALPTNVPTLAPTSAPTNTPTYQPTCETI
eukprot:968063_1